MKIQDFFKAPLKDTKDTKEQYIKTQGKLYWNAGDQMNMCAYMQARFASKPIDLADDIIYLENPLFIEKMHKLIEEDKDVLALLNLYRLNLIEIERDAESATYYKDKKKHRQFIDSLSGLIKLLKEEIKLQTRPQMLLLQDHMDKTLLKAYDENNPVIKANQFNVSLQNPFSTRRSEDGPLFYTRPYSIPMVCPYEIRFDRYDIAQRKYLNWCIQLSELNKICTFNPKYEESIFEVDPIALQNKILTVLENGNIGKWKASLLDYMDKRSKEGVYTGSRLGYSREKKLDAAEKLYHALSGRLSEEVFLKSPELKALRQGKLNEIAKEPIEYLQKQAYDKLIPVKLSALKERLKTITDQDTLAAMQQIVEIVEQGLKETNPVQFFKDNETSLTPHLTSLQKTSNQTTVKNFCASLAACLSVIGIVVLYATGQLEFNRQTKGSYFMFWADGDKQKAEELIHIAKHTSGPKQ